MKRVLSIVAFLLCAASAMAQTPIQNPTLVQFDKSADHALLTGYDVGYYSITLRADGSCDTANVPAQPMMVSPLGLGVPDASGRITDPLPAKPAMGCFVAKVRAVTTGAVSLWSDPSNPFLLAPAAPVGSPVIK